MERRVEVGANTSKDMRQQMYGEAIVEIILATGDSAEQRCHAKGKAARGSKLEVGNKELKEFSGIPVLVSRSALGRTAVPRTGRACRLQDPSTQSKKHKRERERL